MLLHRRLRISATVFVDGCPKKLDVARDNYRIEIFELKTAILAPLAELADGSAVRDPSVWISDVGGEEFDEAERSFPTGSGDDRRQTGESEIASSCCFLVLISSATVLSWVKEFVS